MLEKQNEMKDRGKGIKSQKSEVAQIRVKKVK